MVRGEIGEEEWGPASRREGEECSQPMVRGETGEEE